MSDTAPASERVRRRPLRASVYFLGLVFALCVGGAIYLWQGVGSTSVYGAARDLPAFQRIEETDIRRVEVRSSAVPDHATTVRDALLGHYTVGPVRQDDPFDTSQLGPVLPEQTLDSARVIGLRASVADAVDGRLARGDQVDILLSSPTVTRGRATSIRNAVVLDVIKRSTYYVLVFALTTAGESDLLRAGGRGRVFFSRTAPFRRP